MATSVVPALIDALVAAATTALGDGVQVLDGGGVTNDPRDYLMIGQTDPDAEDWDTGADTQQDPAVLATTRPRDEYGVIPCVALSWRGGTQQKRARDAVYTTVAAVENLIRTNNNSSASPYLGVTGLYQLGFAAGVLEQSQSDIGAGARVLISISFKARI